MSTVPRRDDGGPPDETAQWYKDAVIYQLHVRAYADSNSDGIGDFRGLTEKLDYLQDLGVTAVWLLPFYPSPLKDDGYDISDYTAIHPQYGTMADFRRFQRAAHERGLQIITELVINHTSDQHPWFQRARRARPGSRQRNFYVWSDDPTRYSDARIIFQDFESSNWAWDGVAQQYFWHRFYSQQPDLNFDSPDVRRAVVRALDFWFRQGVDGLRLDAVPYLYEREGTTCENLPETHDMLRRLRRHVDRHFGDRMLLAEANQWPEDAIAYFGGQGEECHMAFHFPLMPRLFMAIRQEDRFPIIDILQQTPPIPDVSQWAIFLRNHDELTLEMVTDEERDYMYRVYAHDTQARINLGIRRRLAPLLENDRRKIELMNGLLFSMPGTPVLYYGDEIGMGDNIYLGDRNGVRTPMQWSGDRNAGFSRANPQQLYLPVIIDPVYHYESVNVEAQQHTPHSLLNWTKRMIGLRKRLPVFGRGRIDFLYPENRKVLAFMRSDEDTRVLVIANLSRHPQAVELDLSEHRTRVPVELMGQTPFPPIGDLPYFLTLGPYAFMWFLLQPERHESIAVGGRETPTMRLAGTPASLFRGRSRERLEALLPADLVTRRWFAGKARRIQGVNVEEAVPIPLPGRDGDVEAFMVTARVDYSEGEPETYALPLAVATGERADQVVRDLPGAVVARLAIRRGEEAVLFDALYEEAFCESLLGSLRRRRRFRGDRSELVGVADPALRGMLRGDNGSLDPHLLRGEQSNASVVYGDRLILKLFRKLEVGENPDRELGKFLTERAGFEHTPAQAGAIELRRRSGETMTLVVAQQLVPNEGDAWRYTLDVLDQYYERAVHGGRESYPEVVPPPGDVLRAIDYLPNAAEATIGAYLQSAELLGRRTAEMHLALASETEDEQFAPEPITALYQRSLYQSMRTLSRRTFALLRRSLRDLPEPLAEDARAVLDAEADLLARCRSVVDRRIDAARTRVHGDYHLGQVLYTGRDFVIIDFEGEPARPLGERRLKRSPLRDVAGMLRSFHYAAYSGLFALVDRDVFDSHEAAVASLGDWAEFWSGWVGGTFMRTYLDAAEGAVFLPPSEDELRMLLEAHLLEKAVYEVGYELNNRPDWVRIPLAGIRRLLEEE